MCLVSVLGAQTKTLHFARQPERPVFAGFLETQKRHKLKTFVSGRDTSAFQNGMFHGLKKFKQL